MTVIIPYKDDILSGVELLYALRSIEKNLTGFTNLVIIGEAPEWFKGESFYVKDHNGRKQFNIYSKILAACELDNVTEEFIFWNDDHFLLEKLDVTEIKYWYDGYLKETAVKSHGARYLETINYTLKSFPDALNYDIHTPIKYYKKFFTNIFRDKQDEVCIKTRYCSLWNFMDHLIVPMKDLKINQLLSKEAIKILIKDRLFFSTSTNGMKKPMIELLNELYPNKSQWEL